MKKFFFFLIFIFFCSESGFCNENLQIPDSLKPGITRSRVKSLVGIPVQMRGDMWKYRDYVIIFQSNALKCIVRSNCFGKWSDCRSFTMRSPDCLINAENKKEPDLKSKESKDK